MRSGCELTYEYTADAHTDWQLIDSDKDALGLLTYRIYAAKHDVYSELAKVMNRPEVVHLPPQNEGSAYYRSQRRKYTNQGNDSARKVPMPRDTLDDVNNYLRTFQLIAPELHLRLRAGWLECSRGAMASFEDLRLNEKTHLERALQFIADSDPDIQERGLRTIDDEATDSYLLGLPEAQRRQISDVAYRAYKSELAVVQRGVPSPGTVEIDFLGADVLETLHDPRAVDAYMGYVMADQPLLGSMEALKALAQMLPRPTQIMEQLDGLLEAHESDERIPGRSQMDEAIIVTMIAVGRETARPIFEKLTRSKNEHIAQAAVQAIDVLNDAERHHWSTSTNP